MLYGALTARENIEFAATMFGATHPRDAALSALQRLGVAERADTPVRLLSRGLQQRVSIARAIVHRPRLLLADEPYSGLDALGAAALTDVLKDLRADGAAMVVVTHNVAEGLAVASHAAILRNGRFVRYDAAGSLDVPAYTAQYLALVTADAA
jgi:heme exporter protein A